MVDQILLINVVLRTLVSVVDQLLYIGQTESLQPGLDGVGELLYQGVGRRYQRALNHPYSDRTEYVLQFARADVSTPLQGVHIWRGLTNCHLV